MTSKRLPGVILHNDDELSAELYIAEDEMGRFEVYGFKVLGDAPIDPFEAVRRLPIREYVAYLNSSTSPKRDRVIAMLHRKEIEVTIDFERAPRLRIAGAQARRKPPGFYERFADVYRALSATGERGPAERIAAANDVPVTTVHRWVREARAAD